MCKQISFWHRPDNGDLAVKILDHHDATRQALNLNEALWREGHYLPDGTIEARVTADDRADAEQCGARIKSRWPTFSEFFSWCLLQPGVLDKDGGYPGDLYLRNLTALPKGFKFPEKIGGGLDLSALRILTAEDQEKFRRACGR